MARSTVKHLLSLYSYKSRNLFVRDLVSTRFFHHCQPSRSLICNLQPPPIPKQLELPSNQFTQIRKFGFFIDLYRKWFPLSGNEKPSSDSTEIVQDETKPVEKSSFDSTEVVRNETKPNGKPSFDLAEIVQNVTKPDEKHSFDSTEVVQSETRLNGTKPVEKSSFDSTEVVQNETKLNAKPTFDIDEIVQNVTKPDEKRSLESRPNGKPSFDSADFFQDVNKHTVDEGRTVLESVDKVVGVEERSSFSKIANRDPVEIYKELKDTLEGDKLSRSDRDSLTEIFRCFYHSGWATNQALAVYIGSSFYPSAARKFCRFLEERCKNDLAKHLVHIGPGNEADRFLFPIFVEFCMEEFHDEIKRFREMVVSADMTKPHTWFPFARAMKRKIVYHCGPTNSGKTYNALQRFMEAKKGVYCSPLRLLAMEVFDRVNASGVYCSLITGQERKEFPFSNHTACTVEMVSTDELYDVAVIDEIQMMADPARGYAWTRAMLGLKADEIHLCGDPSVLNIVRKLCKDTGDELVEQHYERFKPLVVEAKTLLGDLKNVKSGDCIVAFSRREIFEVKLAIEKSTNHKCCVIYGALPPETRRLQASLFNNQDNEYDVLVASDAVGMGLNLNIRRVVFYNLSKYNGDKIIPVSASQVKQIAGRAGRRGSRYPDGLTTTLNLDDLDYLIECLKKPFDDVKKVGLFPFYEQVELFAGQVPDLNFPQLLDKFGANCRLDGSYFLCQYFHIKKIANMLERIKGLSLEDRFNFCFSPVNIRDPKAMYHLMRFASSYSQKHPVNIAMGMPKGSARSDAELLDLESRHQVVSMYLWLSNQFEEECFPFVKKAETMATDLAQLLGESLSKVNWKPESRSAQKPKAQHEKEEEGGYQRPTSLIKKKKEEKKMEEKTGSAKKPKKVTA